MLFCFYFIIASNSTNLSSSLLSKVVMLFALHVCICFCFCFSVIFYSDSVFSMLSFPAYYLRLISCVHILHIIFYILYWILLVSRPKSLPSPFILFYFIFGCIACRMLTLNLSTLHIQPHVLLYCLLSFGCKAIK